MAKHRPGRLGRGIALGTALLLAGCAAHPIGTFDRPDYLSDASQAQHDLLFSPGSPDLAPGEAARLDAFLKALVLRAEDDVVLHIGETGSNVLDRRRLQTAHRALSPTPARLRITAAPAFSRPEQRADVALVQVLRYDRLIVECPNAISLEALTYLTPLPRIGCANAANIGHMAASLRDLTAPRSLRPAEAGIAAAAVARERAGTVKEPPSISTGE